MGFIYYIKCKYSRKCAGNLCPHINTHIFPLLFRHRFASKPPLPPHSRFSSSSPYTPYAHIVLQLKLTFPQGWTYFDLILESKHFSLSRQSSFSIFGENDKVTPTKTGRQDAWWDARRWLCSDWSLSQDVRKYVSADFLKTVMLYHKRSPEAI